MEGQAALIIFPAKDPEAAAAFYARLLKTEPYVKSPYYSGFRQGALEIGLAQPDPSRDAGPLVYVDTADLAARIKDLTDGGATVHQDVTEVGGGLQIAVLKDPGGNYIGLRQAP